MPDDDTTREWHGKKYLRTLIDRRFVVKPTSLDQIRDFRRSLDRFMGKLTKANSTPTKPLAAFVVDETNTVTEFSSIQFKSLWKELSDFLLKPDSKWLEFTIQGTSDDGVDSSFTIENPAGNTGSERIDSDGLRLIRTIGVPAKEFPSAFAGEPSLRTRLEGLKARYSAPLGMRFVDSHYSEAELKAKGVVDSKTFWDHASATNGEEKFRVAITDLGVQSVLWEREGPDESALNAELWLREQNYARGSVSFSSGIIPREFRIEEHPLADPQLYLLSAILTGLELLDDHGDDSPEAQAFAMGLRLGDNLKEFYLRSLAPETLKNPNLSKPPKGKQRHDKKTAEYRHLLDLASSWLAQNDDKSMSNSDLVRRFIHDDQTSQKKLANIEEKIRHVDDSKGYSRRHFTESVFSKLRPSRQQD